MVRISPSRNIFAGMCALAAFMGIGRFAYTLIIPSMMADIGLSAGEAGFIASSNLVGYLVGAILAASRLFTGRERAVLVTVLAVNVVLTAGMAFTDSVALLSVNRFLGGTASAMGMIFVTSLVSANLLEAGRPGLLMHQFTGVGGGIIISSIVCALVSGGGGGWRESWIACGALTLLAMISVLLSLDQEVSVRARGDHEPPLPRSRKLRNITIAYGLFGFGYIVTSTFLIAIVRENGDTPDMEAMIWLVTGVAILPSTYLWGRLAKTIGLPLAYAAGCFVEAAGVMASVALGGIGGPLLGAILLGGTFVASTAIGVQYGRELAPNSPRKTLATMTTLLSVTQILGPIVAGLIAERTGNYFLASTLAAIVLVMSGLCVVRDR